MSDTSKRQQSATWGSTYEFALTWVSNSENIKSGHARKTQLRLANFRAFPKKNGEERIYGQKGFAVEQFSKPRFSPLSFDHIIATMSGQTPSWFEEIKSDLATHRLFPIHQTRIFDSTAEIRTLQQLPTCVDWNWIVCQLTHLDEWEHLRSMTVLQSSHVHGIFRAQAYFLDKAS